MMDKIINQPWLLRITALLLSILLFFTVESTNDNNENQTVSGTKEETIEMNLDVKYDNDNFVVTGEPETVAIKIKGPTGIVLSVKNTKNFDTYIELKDKTIGTHRVKVQVANLSDKVDYTIDPAYVKVHIQEKVSKQVKVEPQITQQQLEDGHYIVSSSVEPQTVTASGASDDMKKIAYVKAIVPGNSIDSSVNQMIDVKAFDTEWNPVDVTFSPETVRVKVDVDDYSKEVPIKIEQRGQTVRGIKITSVKPLVDKIRLYGPEDTLSRINSLNVAVPISDVRESMTKDIPVVLPTGVTFASDSKIRVKIITDSQVEDVPVETTEEQATMKTIENVPINILNYDPEVYDIEFVEPSSKTVTLSVEGDSKDIQQLKASDFNVSADANGLSQGKNTLQLTVDGPTNVKVTPSIQTVKINIQKKED